MKAGKRELLSFVQISKNCLLMAGILEKGTMSDSWIRKCLHFLTSGVIRNRLLPLEKTQSQRWVFGLARGQRLCAKKNEFHLLCRKSLLWCRVHDPAWGTWVRFQHILAHQMSTLIQGPKCKIIDRDPTWQY